MVSVNLEDQRPFRILGLPLGSNRLPSTNILDLRVEKEFPIHTGQLRITADIFNVFNSSYVTSMMTFMGPVSEILSLANQQVPAPHYQPRSPLHILSV